MDADQAKQLATEYGVADRWLKPGNCLGHMHVLNDVIDGPLAGGVLCMAICDAIDAGGSDDPWHCWIEIGENAIDLTMLINGQRRSVFSVQQHNQLAKPRHVYRFSQSDTAMNLLRFDATFWPAYHASDMAGGVVAKGKA